MLDVELLVILLGWILATATPGPATISIISCAISSNRKEALIMAAGIVTGSAVWGIVAAIGMGVIMYANAWIVEAIRYLGAAYLLYLACKSFRRALSSQSVTIDTKTSSAMRTFVRGFFIHLFNPKAVFQWGALFAVVLPSNTGFSQTVFVLLTLLSGSTFVFVSYALLFSSKSVVKTYTKMSRYLELGFAVFFGFAGVKLLTSRFNV
jgi:threonine efflux protein